jgi:tripartite-type tricarboxylate transporter receptor subunit TctC
MAHVKMLHIPYKSGGQLVVGVVSGEAHLSFSPVSTVIVRRLHAATLKAIATPEFKEYIGREGSVLVGSTPEEFGQFLRAEIEKLTPIIKASGAKAE